MHVCKDTPVTWKEVDEARSQVAKHMKALYNIYNPGKNWGEEEEGRTRRVLMEQVTIVPPVIIHQKDHKDVDENGDPSTRAICNASITFNQRVTDLLNDQLVAILNVGKTDECISTEEFLHSIESLND